MIHYRNRGSVLSRSPGKETSVATSRASDHLHTMQTDATAQNNRTRSTVVLTYFYVVVVVVVGILYTVRQKSTPQRFCRNFNKNLPISELSNRHILKDICNKVITKRPTSPRRRRYTTLWNVNVRKIAKIINQ